LFGSCASREDPEGLGLASVGTGRLADIAAPGPVRAPSG